MMANLSGNGWGVCSMCGEGREKGRGAHDAACSISFLYVGRSLCLAPLLPSMRVLRAGGDWRRAGMPDAEARTLGACLEGDSGCFLRPRAGCRRQRQKGTLAGGSLISCCGVSGCAVSGHCASVEHPRRCVESFGHLTSRAPGAV